MATGQPCSSPKATTSSADVRNSVVPGTPATPAALGGEPRRHLVAHDLDGLGRRADEGHALGRDGPGEVGVLAEEPVAGMDTVGARSLDDIQDLVGGEVALGRGLAAQRVGLVGQPDVQAVAVEVGVDGDAADAEVTARPDDPDRDLAPVGDQDLREHAVCLRGCPAMAPETTATERGRPWRAPGSQTFVGWRRPGPPTPMCWRWPGTAPPRAWWWWPTTRPRGGAATTEPGWRRRAARCCSRCCSAPRPGARAPRPWRRRWPWRRRSRR